jgi:predicted nucleotidyltransferase component of viral defense system
MITKEEIEAKAAEFEIHPANVERDYVFGWVLTGIYTASTLRDVLVLKGGNCFRKAYFPTTRFSNDLDFSTQSAVDPSLLLTELNRVCDFVQEQTGVVFEKDKNRAGLKQEIDDKKRVYEARLYFKDFYGNPDTITISIRMDITEFDRIYLPIQTRHIIHPYSDSAVCSADLRCIKLEEMLATKLKCLLQRRHLADLYDYVFAIFVNRELQVGRAEVVRTFFQKTIFQREPRAVSGLLLGLPFQAFKHVWHKYLICPRGGVIEFDTAVTQFVDNIKALFGDAVQIFGRSIYFPADLRNPIIDAGSGKKLLAITYDGVRREVEPYALAFKQRTDGHAEEYLYVWDRTGGRSTPPGIKTFVSSKIQQLEPLDQTFEPKYEIELGKAGEQWGKSYFGKPFGTQRVTFGTSTRTARSHHRTVFVIQCTYCGKKFKRIRRNTALKQHKDGFGNRCFGRRGVIVDQYQV